MDTARRPSQLEVRLTNAQRLFDNGKQRLAVQELWYAEALVRGDSKAIRKLIDCASGFKQHVEPKQESRLVELVAALKHDALQATDSSASGPLPPPCADPAGGRAFYLGLVLSLLLAAAASAVILLIWVISATMCSCSPHDVICIFGDPATSGAGAHLAGAATGLFFGGIGLLLPVGYMVFRFRGRLAHPFLILILGFPVFYGVVLLSIWGIARGVWGPTKC
jgi:hypothetical protein